MSTPHSSKRKKNKTYITNINVTEGNIILNYLISPLLNSVHKPHMSGVADARLINVIKIYKENDAERSFIHSEYNCYC